ncbi:FAD-dependent monooxygenase [Myxococcus sp. K38C18041901]|uniref:FAD-dependent oxidoreductase n=1 Tax=Myxococcus guangdongensis TaxID=2906760 RepID=UPI0020A7D478|nr:NAD(P)/FAD-dependent oxidoreductase [Myxococcus guangdongensis]MCP3065723.1 FAD-dependent monooxygenase [Myxococcus guangdongensis]
MDGPWDFDVVVVGGGPAGCAAAAALAQLGQSVLLVDAGVDRHKQLSGELLHPTGVHALRELGFSEVIDAWLSRPVRGFAIFYASPARVVVLPYKDGTTGLSLEHVALAAPLLEAVVRKPGVTLLAGARVTSVEHNDERGVRLRFQHDGVIQEVRARLLVASDGRASPVRRMLGISESYTRISTMLGLCVDSACLPRPEHGHKFVGGPLYALAYAIQPGVARVMVDLPLGTTSQTLKERPELLATLPPALVAEIRRALEATSTLRMASNDARLSERVWKGSAVLVGDAASCCHPLSGSGMTSCFQDARALQDALRCHPRDMPRALEQYARVRRPAQRTRVALASSLYSACAGQDEGMQALRLGLIRYWDSSPRSARAAMSLLSSEDSRMTVLAREYLCIVGHSLMTLRPGQQHYVRPRAAVSLLRSAGPPLRAVLASTLEQVEGWCHRRLRHLRRHARPLGQGAAQGRRRTQPVTPAVPVHVA